MIPEMGQLTLCLAFALSLSGPALGLLLLWKGAQNLEKGEPFLRACSWGIGISLLLSFLALTWSYAVSDFSVLNVMMNSHPHKPLLYKIGGLWGNHEGSMLLWALIMGLYPLFFICLEKTGPRLTFWILLIHACLLAPFLGFTVLTSNPFIRFFPAPSQGLGLNPLLQDPSLTIHPPILYLGYVGYSLIFSLTAGEILAREKAIDILERWSLGIWAFLTAGIGLGAWWASYTLGWGGWWFWDPVENASLFPWLGGTALLHQIRYRRLTGQGPTRISFFLGTLPFTLSLLGTTLVRSGIVSSVHAFAKDPTRGLFLGALFLSVVALAFGLGRQVPHRKDSSPLREKKPFFFSKEKALAFCLWIFLSALGMVLLGTLYPVFLAWGGKEALVSPSYYHWTFLPLMGGGILVMGLAPWLLSSPLSPSWAGLPLKIKSALAPVGVGLLVLFFLVLRGRGAHFWQEFMGYGLGIWVVGSTLPFLRKGKSPMALSHLGVGIFILGMTGQTVGKDQAAALLLPGESFSLASYYLHLKEVKALQGPNYIAEQAVVEVRSSPQGASLKTLFPERRFYPVPEKITFQTAIYSTLQGDVYTAVGEHRPDGRWAIYAYYNPFMQVLWGGVLGMVLGGLGGAWGWFRRKRRSL